MRDEVEKASNVLLIHTALGFAISSLAAPPFIRFVPFAVRGPPCLVEEIGGDCFAHQSITGFTRKKTVHRYRASDCIFYERLVLVSSSVPILLTILSIKFECVVLLAEVDD